MRHFARPLSLRSGRTFPPHPQRERSPALTPALRAGKSPERRLRGGSARIVLPAFRLPSCSPAGVNARPTIRHKWAPGKQTCRPPQGLRADENHRPLRSAPRRAQMGFSAVQRLPPFEKRQPAAAQRNNGSRFPAAGAALPQSRLFYACAPAASRAASMAHSASMTRARPSSMETCGVQPYSSLAWVLSHSENLFTSWSRISGRMP